MLVQVSNWECCRCGDVLFDYGEVAYDGPPDPTSTECYPFMDWLVLCPKCLDADPELKQAVEQAETNNG